MEKNYILQADILDIIFEGKNKLYGAYELRKTYDKRLIKAVFFTTGLVLVAIFGGIYSSMAGKSDSAVIEFVDTELASVKTADPLPPVIPEPPKITPPVPVKAIQFTAPVIVKPDQVTEADQLHDITDEVAIGSETVETGERGTIAPPVEEKASAVIEQPKTDDQNKIFISVQNEAQFPGGQAAWIRYLQKSLNPTIPVENGASPGTYQVIVKFVVSMDGSVSDVTAETKHGFGMEDEAMKIIRRGPKWTPALQNGRNVNAYRRQPITFVIEEQ